MRRTCTYIFLFIFVSVIGCAPGSDSGPIQFTDVSRQAGLSAFKHESGAVGNKWFPETMGAGVGFIDYNGDDWYDVLLVGGTLWEEGNKPAVSLFENNQDGTFSNVTAEAGLETVHAYGFGLTVADADNDGDEDFLLTTLDANLFFQNNEGVFEEVGSEIGISDRTEWSTSAVFFDADMDGWLDLVTGQYVAWSPETDQWCTIDTVHKEYCTPELYEGQPLRFYRNQGDGIFLEDTESAGFGSSVGKALGIALIDYNMDGGMDVVVANDTERDLLFENTLDGTFEERGLRSGMALSGSGKATAGMGIDTGFIDSTGLPTIVIGNFTKEQVSVFQYSESGLFRDKTTVSQLANPSFLTNTFGLLLFDVDLDSDADLFAYNGHVHERVAEVQEGVTHAQFAQLYLNNSRGVFKEVELTVNQQMVGRGAAYADYDRDGDLDVLLLENNGSARLWRNDSETGNSLQVKPISSKYNTTAIGARVEVQHGVRKQVQWVKTGSSYLSASSQVLTFGLGSDEKVDTLTIHWPDGSTDTYLDIPVQQRVTLVQGQQGIKSQYQLEGTSS